jgi:hypothetical protein
MPGASQDPKTHGRAWPSSIGRRKRNRLEVGGRKPAPRTRELRRSMASVKTAGFARACVPQPCAGPSKRRTSLRREPDVTACLTSTRPGRQTALSPLPPNAPADCDISTVAVLAAGDMPNTPTSATARCLWWSRLNSHPRRALCGVADGWDSCERQPTRRGHCPHHSTEIRAERPAADMK